MSKPYKLLFFTILVSAVAIAIIVYRYERLLEQHKKQEQDQGAVWGSNAMDKQYAASIIESIKKSKEYLGDTITILHNGDLLSSNKKFQGTIKAVIDSKDNMDIVRNNARTNLLPLQYNVYVLAAGYYRQQYASEFQPQ